MIEIKTRNEHQNMRVVFASCSEDPWIDEIPADIYKASQNLGFEFVFIGASKKNSHPEYTFVNLNKIEKNRIFTNICKFVKHDINGIEEQKQFDYEYYKIRDPHKSINLHYIEKNLIKWFNEAIVLYKIIQPDIVIIWNGKLAKRSMFLKAAQYLNITVFYAEKGMLPNSWYIDPYGINAESTLVKEADIVKGKKDNKKRINSKDRKIELESIFNQNEGESAWEQPEHQNRSQLIEKYNIDIKKKIILFPGQVDNDTNILLYSPHFSNCAQVLNLLARELPEDEFFILAKPHPKGNLTKNDFQQIIGPLGVAVDEINIIDAISICDCVVTINSTVAFEASIRGKPVLLLGKGVLSNQNFITKYKSGKSIFTQIVDCIQEHEYQKEDKQNESLNFGSELKNQYYLFKNDEKKVIKCIKEKIYDDENSRKKDFSIEELYQLFNNNNNLNGSILLKYAFCELFSSNFKILKI
ncbi:MAG: hypothetical protein QCI00_06650 [Candidatus Thermoplasmatota archaeon]|nr:hypothetical protein [Candidatus Thermoplasmatota archaeon]